MNKYQEALDYLAVSLQVFDETVDDKPYRDELEAKRENARKELQGLVDKATPKAPNVEHSGWRSPDGVSVLTFFKYKCPCCERRVTDIDKFCPECGQAIDWGKR